VADHETNLICSSLKQAGELQSVSHLRFRLFCMHVKIVLPGRHNFDLTQAFPSATSLLPRLTSKPPPNLPIIQTHHSHYTNPPKHQHDSPETTHQLHRPRHRTPHPRLPMPQRETQRMSTLATTYFAGSKKKVAAGDEEDGDTIAVAVKAEAIEQDGEDGGVAGEDV
jgi:hypothetical protein